MPLTHLEGQTYQADLAVTDDRVGAFVDATTDNDRRWVHHAPPSFAAVALFAVAPEFLFAPAVGDYSKMLMHADQTFAYHQPFEVGMDLDILGSVERVRMRGDVGWVTFATTVSSGGDLVVESTSLFLMSASDPPAGNEPRPEPEPHARKLVQRPQGPSVKKSASRADLIRYAAASNDFNPLHWDHETAVAAGLPGVVAHGLLTAAWATQVTPPGPNAVMPITSVRFRFPQPVLPDTQLHVVGETPEDGTMTVHVTAEGANEPSVTAIVELG